MKLTCDLKSKGKRMGLLVGLSLVWNVSEIEIELIGDERRLEAAAVGAEEKWENDGEYCF